MTELHRLFIRPLFLALVVVLAGCGGDGENPLVPDDARLELSFSGLPALDPATEGSYAVWVVSRTGTRTLAQSFSAPPPAPIVIQGGAAPATIEVTVQKPGMGNDMPSPQLLLRGDLRGTRVELSIAGAVTQGGLPLQEQPGQFTMYFTPSDNWLHGEASNEESGVWLFNIAPRQTQQGDGWVRMTPLQDGWVYEGWVIRDLGTPNEIWLSYGKFRPDQTGAVNTRDDTGWGPFSSVEDYRTAGEEEYPGDDWISNPLGYPWPDELSLPLNLKETDSLGRPRWSHMVTIEPAWNKGEPIRSERPFILRPYRDGFTPTVEGLHRTYGLPQSITYRPQGIPQAVVEVR